MVFFVKQIKENQIKLNCSWKQIKLVIEKQLKRENLIHIQLTINRH